MRVLVVAVSALTLFLGACNRNEEVSADTGPAVAIEAPTNEAVDTTPGNEAGAPFAGANSFTEGQALSRLGEMGYSNPMDMRMGEDGIWRGKAQKDGQTVDVAVDFQGNVTP